jgi:hypothetical protein
MNAMRQTAHWQRAAANPPSATRVDLLKVFFARADARAYLWHVGELTLRDAVDRLQDHAERDDLAERLTTEEQDGRNAVQTIMAAAFSRYMDRDDG